jgi:hypothetical protein
VVRQCGAGRPAVPGRRRRPAMGCELDATERARGRCTRLPVAHSLARWNAAVSFPLRHGREAGRSVCGTVCAGAKRCLRKETLEKRRKLSEKRRKLRRSVGNGYTEPRQKQFAAGMRRNVAIGGHPQATKRKRYSGTRTRTVLATGAGTRQRRRQCGGRSLCRYIRWTPKAAPTDPKRAPPVCAQLSSVSTRVRHALPRTRVLRRREVQCGGRPEDNG